MPSVAFGPVAALTSGVAPAVAAQGEHADPRRQALDADPRRQALAAAAAGRYDEARTLLERFLRDPRAPRLDVIADLAAIALRAGDLVQAIALARHVVGERADDDAAAFTLAMGLAAIGSHAEALERFDLLSRGVRGARFGRSDPPLAALAASEAARLHALLHPIASPASPAGAAKYALSHLDQPADQAVMGPIQDDEALLLYAVVRTMRLRRILEIGGLSGYSARNFLRAVGDDDDTAVYTVDLNPVERQGPKHHTIRKDAARLESADLHDRPLDLVFFDCHVYDAQMRLFERLSARGLITGATVIALHDTNLHPAKLADWCYAVREADGTVGWIHQDVERRMVNELHERHGYQAFCAHTDPRRHDARLPYRHGLTLMKRFDGLAV